MFSYQRKKNLTPMAKNKIGQAMNHRHHHHHHHHGHHHHHPQGRPHYYEAGGMVQSTAGEPNSDEDFHPEGNAGDDGGQRHVKLGMEMGMGMEKEEGEDGVAGSVKPRRLFWWKKRKPEKKAPGAAN